MKKVWTIVFLIFGTIVGSGFSSGKEIFVFFSRFGNLSYLYIFIACVLFFFLFYLFLSKGSKVTEKFENLKIINIIMIFISIVFTASMFAGLKSLFSFSGSFTYILLCAGLLLLTLYITLKGMKMLEKFTAFIMPVCAFIFLGVLVFLCFQKSTYIMETESHFGFLYSPLYVALNFSTSTFIVAKAGNGLTKKQTFFISLFSSLLLFAFLTFGNVVLRTHPESFYADMPFLYLCQGNKFFFTLSYIVIFIGCLTTLLSLCLTLKESLSNFFKSEVLLLSLSIFLPFLISECGFSYIVSYLYPVSSVMAIFLLLFFISSFQKTNKKIHQEGKYAKDKGGGHN